MKKTERQLLQALKHADNYDDIFNDNYGGSFENDNDLDAPVVKITKTSILGESKGVGAGVTPIKGMPRFTAQFDINMTLLFYDVTGSADVAPAALPVSLKVDVPAFMFGNSDWASAFRKSYQLMPTLGEWNIGTGLGLVGVDVITPTLAGAALAQAQRGDLVLGYTATVAINDYAAFVIINCKQVGYGTLLDSLSSDRFIINNIRYNIPDVTKINQYEKQLKLMRQSLFGKVSDDFISPASFKRPDQFQTNVVDIPIVYGIDKNNIIGTYLGYDVGEILLSIFVVVQKKISAKDIG